MKKLILATALLSVLLVACNKSDSSTNQTASNTGSVDVLTNQTNQADQTNNSKTEQTTNTSTDETQGSTTDKTQNSATTENSESTEKAIDNTDIKSLIENSDYISRIKINAVGNSSDVTFIQDYKGDLSNIVLELPKGLKDNQEYILFYIDGKDGALTPVTEGGGFIELSGSDDSRLKTVEKTLGITSTPKVVESTSSETTVNLQEDKTNTSGVESTK